MIWQCKGCRTCGFYFTDEERDRKIEEHAGHIPEVFFDGDDTDKQERPYNESAGPCSEIVGWTPGGTPDTGLGGGVPDSGKFSHPQTFETQNSEPKELTRAEIIADLLRAWDEVKREGI